MKKVPDVRVFDTPEKLAEAAAGLFASVAVREAAEKGFFTAVLSGGRTPEMTLRSLASSVYSSRAPWQKTHLFWGDERCVPPESPDSNFRMAMDALLSKVDIPRANIHRMHGELPPEEAALAYETEIGKFFAGRGGSGPGSGPAGGGGLGGVRSVPVFDLVLLGLGVDGHTLSLFPETAAVAERKKLVVENYVEELKIFRLTMTLPLVNNARRVVFLVSGRGKAEILKRVLDDDRGDGGRGARDGGGSRFPAALVRPESGELIWLVDGEAASRL
jgi:6-phosphogluconolactonase